MWIGDKSSGIKKSNRVYSINLSFTVEMVRNVLNINKKSVIESLLINSFLSSL
jgi:hypothetical protein